MSTVNAHVFDEDDLLPLSGVQHIVFCERRAALIHIEGLWDENVFTAEGRNIHERAHGCDSTESRGDVRIARGLMIHSLRLGLSGKADVVEFHRVEEGQGAVRLEGVSGFWQPFPVEYKRGVMRHERSFEVQVCAQALCLEEMLAVSIACGALFYGKSQRRYDVTFDETLRCETADAARRLHELVRAGETPRAEYQKKCAKCSLIDLCMPKATAARQKAGRYLDDIIAETKGGDA